MSNFKYRLVKIKTFFSLKDFKFNFLGLEKIWDIKFIIIYPPIIEST